MKTGDKSQHLHSPVKRISRTLPAKRMPSEIESIFQIQLLVLRKSTLGRAQFLGPQVITAPAADHWILKNKNSLELP